MQSLSKIADALILGLLWLAFCIPVITIGASTASLYYTVHKVLRKGNGTILAEFWKAFKAGFKQSTVLFVVMVIVGLIVYCSLYYGYSMYLAGALEVLYIIVLCAFDLMVLGWLGYLLPYTARFNATTKEILKNCAAIAFINIFPTVGVVAIWLVTWFLALNIPPMLLILPVFSAWITSSILEKVFRKYMTEEAIAEEATAEDIVDLEKE